MCCSIFFAPRDELLSKIIQICSQNDYQYISNFEWYVPYNRVLLKSHSSPSRYVSVLVELSQLEGGGGRHGAILAQQMMDVAIRFGSIVHSSCFAFLYHLSSGLQQLGHLQPNKWLCLLRTVPSLWRKGDGIQVQR